MFGFTMENTKKNQIYLKLVRNVCILKLFNLYIIKENEWKEFEKAYKNNLLTLNLFFIFLHFFFPFTFPLYFLFLLFSFKFSGNRT